MAEGKTSVYRLEDVARELNLSKTTVSRALSGKGRIGAETRERVKRFVAEHNCRLNLMARGLAQRKTFNIGLAMMEEFGVGDLPFFHRCASGICQVASQNDYDVVLFRIGNRDTAQLRRVLDNQKVDGVILTRTFVEDCPAGLLKESGTPFVVVGSSEDAAVTHADNDHVRACATLMRLLMSRGLQKFALLCGSTDSYVNLRRIEGFRTGCSEGGAEGRVWPDAASGARFAQSVREIVRSGADCLICGDDDICTRAVALLSKESVRVPEDISVATFYRSSLLNQSSLQITGLEFDEARLGGIACRMLLDKLEGLSPPDYLEEGFRVQVGNSTK